MSHTSEEMMAVAASRRLHDGTVCFVGIGLPSKAANLGPGNAMGVDDKSHTK